MQVARLDDLRAQAGRHGDLDLVVVELLVRARLGGHLLVGGQARLALGLAGLGARAHPLQLLLQLLRQLLLALALRLDAGGLRLQVGGVVALVGEEAAAVYLADPLGHVVEEVAVVRDGQHRAGVVPQELLEPEHRFRVQVVRGLVEQQQVGRLEQQAAERHAAPLAAGEVVDRFVGVGALQRVHGLGELAVKVPAVRGVDLGLELAHLLHERVEVGVGLGHLHADGVEALHLREDVAEGLLDVLEDRLILVEGRFLEQDAHGIARREARLAVRDLLEAGHGLEQGGLAHAVRPHDADLRAGVERQRHVVEDDLVAVRLAGLMHLVNEFWHVELSGSGFVRARAIVARAGLMCELITVSAAFGLPGCEEGDRLSADRGCLPYGV